MESATRLSYASPDQPWYKRALIRALEIESGLLHRVREYEALTRAQGSTTEPASNGISAHIPHAEELRNPWRRMLHVLDVTPVVDPAAVAGIPATGPLVLLANHPFGILDGILLCYLASLRRSDFAILINSVVADFPGVSQHFLPVDFSGTTQAAVVNLASRRAAQERVARGECILIFPAGGVATTRGFRDTLFGPARDLEWSPFAHRLITQTRAPIVPVHFSGQNSRLFQLVSQFSLTLRLGLLLHEIKNKRGSTVTARVGEAIAFQQMEHLTNRTHFLRDIRARVEALRT